MFANENNLKISMSTLNGKLTKNVLSYFGDNSHISLVLSQTNTSNKVPKHNSLLDPKSYLQVFKDAKRNKSELIFLYNENGDNFRAGFKYQRRYKFMQNDEIGAVYLNWICNNQKLNKNSHIVIDKNVSNLVEKVANKYNIKVIMLDKAKKTEENNAIFTIKNSVITFPNKSKINEMINTTNIISDFVFKLNKEQNNLYAILKSLWEEHGLYRSKHIEKSIPSGSKNRFIKRVKSQKKIGDQKIIKIEDFSSKEKSALKIYLKNGSWVFIVADEQRMIVDILNHDKDKHSLYDIVSYEEIIANWIEEMTEVVVEKKFTLKVLFKYLIFTSIIVGILSLVFMYIYRDSRNKNGDVLSTYSIATLIANSQMRVVWASVYVWAILSRFLGAWSKKRMFMINGVKVKLVHIVISELMGSVISFVTPFAIGGDVIGYWYLRRKNVPRGVLISTLLSNTILFQARFVLETLILIFIGFPVYKMIFATNNIESRAAFIWFIVGLFWSLFSTFMIMILVFSKRVQGFIIRNATRILEWTSFYMIIDPAGRSSKVMYEFKMMRQGSYTIWKKHWWFPLEIILYSLIPLFFVPTAIIFATGGWVSSDIPTGSYWSQIVVDDIVSTANSMSLTPGGSGTLEWLSIITKQIIYNGSPQQTSTGLSPSSIASGWDLLTKVLFDWPTLLISTISIISVVNIENRRMRIDRINKNNLLMKKSTISDTRAKLVWSAVWVAIIAVLLVYFFIMILV